MIIYASYKSERIEYILNHIFNTILGLNFKVVTNKETFINSKEEVKISYGEKFNINEVYLPKNSSILFKKTVDNAQFNSIIEGLKKADKNTIYKNFDSLALSFLLLTRYQEYLPFSPDVHQRFPFLEDNIFKHINISNPFIDEFAYYIRSQIVQISPNFKFSESKYKIISTIDIDQTWKYKETPTLTLLYRILKNCLKGNFTEIKSILQYFNTQKDPYNVFNYIQTTTKKNKVENYYFYLFGNLSKYDRNINYNNLNQKKQLQLLSKSATIEIHPSYQSNNHPELVKFEIANLEMVLKKKITRSRQHYIKLQFPDTYNSLINNGIEEDYTMGFPDKIGFRAGTSYPFLWFNISKNKVTNLKIYPFCIMDVTLKNYMKTSILQAIKEIKKLQENCKKVNGVFIPIFHNQSLSNKGEWKGWRKVFESIFTD